MNGSVVKSRRLFVVYVYVSNDCSCREGKNEFYHEVSRLLQNARPVDVVVVVAD